jgi:hypothetical protein
MCREKIMGAKMKTFFTHCLGRMDITKYFSVAMATLYQKDSVMRNEQWVLNDELKNKGNALLLPYSIARVAPYHHRSFITHLV